MKTFVIPLLAATISLGTQSLLAQSASVSVKPVQTEIAAEPAMRADVLRKEADAEADVLLEHTERNVPVQLRAETVTFDGRTGETVTFDEGTGVMELHGAQYLSPGRGISPPLVIRTGDMPSKTLANLQEDLTVMSRILTKTVEREVGPEGRDAAMGITLSTLPGLRRPQNAFLEGYGALFFLSVKFPLAPPAKEVEEKTEQPADTTWEQTKQELYGSRPAETRIWAVTSGREAEAEYDREQVEKLKEALLEALKNATHIRHLKPEEFITIVVSGNKAETSSRVHSFSAKRVAVIKTLNAQAAPFGADDLASPRQTTLTIRVKKSDVDAFAKGELTAGDFEKHAAISAY